MSIADETRDAVLKIAKATLNASVKEWSKSIAKEQLGEAASEAILTVVGDVAKETGEALVGPLLKVLLRVADKTNGKLDAMIREPLQTGLREAEIALTISCESQADYQWRNERFKLADAKLAEARTHAENRGTIENRFYIAFMRGLIAAQAGAASFARDEFRRCESILKPVWEHDLKELNQKMNIIRLVYGYHPAMFRFWKDVWFKEMNIKGEYILDLQEILSFLDHVT